MNEKFSVGQRVRIIDGGFIGEVQGTVSYPPQIQFGEFHFGKNYFREVDTVKGKKLSFWVKFDLPHYDLDGDGPYEEAEILIDYLEAISS